MSDALKRLVKTLLKKAGIAVRRIPKEQSQYAQPDPPPIFDDPLEALHYNYGGRKAAFHCELDQCVVFNGLSYASHGWHPFYATLEEYQGGVCSSYRGSILEEYYNSWQPGNALQSLIGCEEGSSSLSSYPSYQTIFPWVSYTVNELEDRIKRGYRRENKKHGQPDLGVAAGHKLHGPVNPKKGRIEFNRLVNTFKSILSKGYDRRHGDIRVFMLKRDSSFLYLVVGGVHRAAAMKALGYETVPAEFGYNSPCIIDIDNVDYWPQVRRGVWDRETAIQYVNHLFDFDSHAWAEARGLLRTQRGGPRTVEKHAPTLNHNSRHS